MHTGYQVFDAVARSTAIRPYPYAYYEPDNNHVTDQQYYYTTDSSGARTHATRASHFFY